MLMPFVSFPVIKDVCSQLQSQCHLPSDVTKTVLSRTRSSSDLQDSCRIDPAVLPTLLLTASEIAQYDCQS